MDFLFDLMWVRGKMTLQKLCLRKIVEQFERFHFAFSTCKDENLMLKFEFLQRQYSLSIILRLDDENKLEDKYLDLLLNKYLKELHTDWFAYCNWEHIVSKLPNVGPSIQVFRFSDVDMPWLRFFRHFPNLRVILFEESCSDVYLKCIAKHCPNVEELDIHGSLEVTDTGISSLCSGENGKAACPLLKVIHLNDTLVTDAGVKLLIENIHTIDEIDYHRLPQVLHSLYEDVKSLDKIGPYNITQLDLLLLSDDPYYTEAITVCVSVCPHLKCFSCPVITQEHLDLCSQLHDLEELHLKYSGNSPVDISNFLKVKGTKLSSLILVNFKISISDLAQNCHRLKKLSLNSVTFETFNDKSIPLFPNLESLNIQFMVFTDSLSSVAVCTMLANSPKLDELSLIRCSAFSTELKAQVLKCCKQCSLKYVQLNYSNVEKELIREILLTCRDLSLLDLDGCDLEEEFVEDLSAISLDLPNKPEINFTDDRSFESIYDDDFLDDFDDYFDSDDDEDLDSNYLDYDDDYDDEYNSYIF